MALPAGTAGHLYQLAVAADGDFSLTDDLDALLALAVQAVPSCLGVSVTLTSAGLPVTATAITSAGLLNPVRASLSLHLPTAGRGDACLILYASAAGAFAQAAADLAALLDLDPRRATIDAHLQLPATAGTGAALAGQLDDVSAVDRALGVLLDQGLLTADGRLELHRRAAVAQVDLPAAARAVLDSLLPPHP